MLKQTTTLLLKELEMFKSIVWTNAKKTFMTAAKPAPKIG